MKTLTSKTGHDLKVRDVMQVDSAAGYCDPCDDIGDEWAKVIAHTEKRGAEILGGGPQSHFKALRDEWDGILRGPPA